MPSPLDRVPPLRPGRALGLTALAVALAVALAETYAVVGALFDESWLAAAVVHTALALVALAAVARQGGLGALLSLTTVSPSAPAALRARPWLAYVPAAAVLAATGVLFAVSGVMGGASHGDGLGTNPAWLVWVPVVEELTFRVGLGGALRRWAPALWAAWFEALVFALVHASPTVAHLAAGKLGLPLGPFLLALCCEALYAWSGRLWPLVLFHAACNATVVVFTLGDRRWLDWLGFLYG